MSKNSVQIMVNTCYGGFSLSKEAISLYRERAAVECSAAVERAAVECSGRSIPRHDPVMVQIVKELGTSANGHHACIELQDIPVQFQNYYAIHEYDGMENVYFLYDKYRVDAAAAILDDESLPHVERVRAARAALANANKEWFD
jgi:hypothetical protein